MSLCRWSDMDFQCDLYVYEAVDGWCIHIAQSKRRFETPLPPMPPFPLANDPALEAKLQAWLAADRKRQAALDRAKRVRLTLPHAGESFGGLTAKACWGQLKRLKRLGYVMPDYALEEMQKEAGMLCDV